MANVRVNPNITKEVMEQYEALRKSSKVNMRDTNAVYTATAKEYPDLHKLIAEDIASGTRNYLEILVRYDFYLKKHRLRGGSYGKE